MEKGKANRLRNELLAAYKEALADMSDSEVAKFAAELQDDAEDPASRKRRRDRLVAELTAVVS